MKITRKRIIIFTIILLTAIGAWFWYSSRGPKTVAVEQVDIESTSVRETVSASGVMSAENSSDLTFLGSGTINIINVNEGDLVTTGQILATIDGYSASQSAKAAKDARDIALRNRDLFMKQNIDKEAVGGEEVYDIRIRTLNEQISQAEATYRAQLGTLTNLNMKAPFTGTIIDILKKSGETVGPTDTVIKLADLTDVYFELDLDQEDFGKVRIDQIAEIELDAYPDEIFYGRVIELPTYLDLTSGSQLQIKIKLNPTEDKPILLGMAGDGAIIARESTSLVQAVPFDAIFTEEDGRDYVWILNNGVLNKKYVETGIFGDVYTEVIDNLEGQTIVIPTDSSIEINEGDKGQISKQ